MWEDLLNFSESAWESVSESAETYVDAYAKSTTQQEINRDPEVLKNAEPEKGTRTDGTTITPPQNNVNAPQIIAGVSNTTLILGGVLVVGLLFIVAKVS